MSKPFSIRLPATSANLGPGFDSVAVALDFHLQIEAVAAPETDPVFTIEATGRDAALCARLEDNLILDLYRDVLAREGRPIVPLAIKMHNEIPLGMGCGSSAAGRLAALALAVNFGQLDWSWQRILDEAAHLEGHPDNVTACWKGGFVAATEYTYGVDFVSIAPPDVWRAILVLPTEPLPTRTARAVLPESYTRADVVVNLQAVAMLTAAFAQGAGRLLRPGMQDRIHQPYREPICPILPRLLPLVGRPGILGVALSGAGPAVIVIVDEESSVRGVSAGIRSALEKLPPSELITTRFSSSGTTFGSEEVK